MAVFPSLRRTHPRKFCLNLRVPRLLSLSLAPDQSPMPPSPLLGLHLLLTMLLTSSRDILETGPRVPPPVLLYDPVRVKQVQVVRGDVFQQMAPNPNAGSPLRAFFVGGKMRMSREREWRKRRRKASWLDLMEQSFTCFHHHQSNNITGSPRPNQRIQRRSQLSFSPTNQKVAAPLVMKENYE